MEISSTLNGETPLRSVQAPTGAFYSPSPICRDKPIVIAHPYKPPVDAGEPLLLHLLAKALFDLAIGARAEVQANQFGRALAQTRGDIVSHDDEILAAIVLAADDDVGPRSPFVQ